MITASRLPDYKRYVPILTTLACGAAALLLAQHGFAQDAAPAAAAPAPVPNKGDVAWMLTSTALVLLMSVPALALFYGGLVRTKNMLSVLMQVFVGFSLITVLWCIYGYSVAFTEGNSVFGGFSRLFLNGTFNPVDGSFSMAGTFSKGTPLYELVFVGFQATFAAITCCLILGSIVERVKFSAVLIFMVIWFTFSYLPVAHMVWFFQGPDAYTDPAKVDAINATAGYIWQMGALDFAGGTVVHINAGVAGLIGAYLIGKRVGYGKEALKPHSLTMTMIGASLLWFGWFGFNAGSALEANGTAALAFLNTYLATACAVLSWTFAEWILKGKPRCSAQLRVRWPASSRSHRPRGMSAFPRIRDWPARRRDLPVGRHWLEENHQGRRLARCVRRACGRRYQRRLAYRHLQRTESRRTGLGAGLGQDDVRLSGHRRATADPGQSRGHHRFVDSRRRLYRIQDCRSDCGPARL